MQAKAPVNAREQPGRDPPPKCSTTASNLYAPAMSTWGRRQYPILGFNNVFAITCAGCLSVGYFLLQGAAAPEGNPWAYLLAPVVVLLTLPLVLSMCEVMTAMPREQGVYLVQERALGPAAGTVGGLALWLTLVLGLALAMLSIGHAIALWWFDVKEGGGIGITRGQLAKAIGLVLVVGPSCLVLIIRHRQRLEPVQGSGDHPRRKGLVWGGGILHGVTLSAGLFFSMSESDAGPGASPTLILLGTTAAMACLSFTWTGPLGVSRYLEAMSRDGLLPRRLQRTTRNGLPLAAMLVSIAALMLCMLTLDVITMAALAASGALLVFSLTHLALIVMRQSRLDRYDPTFRVPWYPWVPLVGLLTAAVLLCGPGRDTAWFPVAVVLAGGVCYGCYGIRHADPHGAVLTWFARLDRQQSDRIDGELRRVMIEQGARSADPFDETVTRAGWIEVEGDAGYHAVLRQAATLLARRIPRSAGFITEKFIESGTAGHAVVTHGAVLPHFLSGDLAEPELVLIRARGGLNLQGDSAQGGADAENAIRVQAVFALVSPDGSPGVHLRLLAHLAGVLEDPGFLTAWLGSPDEQAVKECLMREERHLSLVLKPAEATAALLDRPLARLALPEGILITMVRRGNRVFVPRAATVLRAGDRVTLIGEPEAIAAVRNTYTSSIAKHASSLPAHDEAGPGLNPGHGPRSADPSGPEGGP